MRKIKLEEGVFKEFPDFKRGIIIVKILKIAPLILKSKSFWTSR
jgi:hypothetical protein